jgi:hypothetical protein
MPRLRAAAMPERTRSRRRARSNSAFCGAPQNAICGARGYAESWIGFGTEYRTVPSRSRMSCRSGATHNPASFSQERSRPARTGCAPAQAKLNSPILAAEPSAHTPTGGNCASERHSRSTVQAFCPAPLRVFQISTAGALAVIPARGGGEKNSPGS